MQQFYIYHFTNNTSPPVQIIITKICRLYNVFGSGACHAIHAIFMTQSAVANKGVKIGLLRGSGTRFALWFYCMHRLLRMREVLMCSIHQAEFRNLKLNNREERCVADIKNDTLFKAMYVLLRAVFPALRALRFCDSDVPCMDKIHYLSKRTTLALEISVNELNDVELFGSLKDDGEAVAELKEVFEEEETDAEDDVDVK